MKGTAWAIILMVLLNSSLRTHFIYDYNYGKTLGPKMCGPEHLEKK